MTRSFFLKNFSFPLKRAAFSAVFFGISLFPSPRLFAQAPTLTCSTGQPLAWTNKAGLPANNVDMSTVQINGLL